MKQNKFNEDFPMGTFFKVKAPSSDEYLIAVIAGYKGGIASVFLLKQFRTVAFDIECLNDEKVIEKMALTDVIEEVRNNVSDYEKFYFQHLQPSWDYCEN